MNNFSYFKNKYYIDGVKGPHKFNTIEGWASNAGHNAAKYIEKNGMDSFEKNVTLNYAIDDAHENGYNPRSPIYFAKAFIKVFDKDKNGKLSYNEFMQQYKKDLETSEETIPVRKMRVTGLEQKFVHMDINEDNEISSSELGAYAIYEDFMTNLLAEATNAAFESGDNSLGFDINDISEFEKEYLEEQGLINSDKTQTDQQDSDVKDYITGFISPLGRMSSDYSPEEYNPIDVGFMQQLYDKYDLNFLEEYIDNEESESVS